MSLTYSILLDEQDVQQFSDYLEQVGRRFARAKLLPILKKGLQPLVDSEKSFLSSHSKSGALVASLAVRSGSGDYPGTISVFATPTAKAKALDATWGTGRRQQRAWAASSAGTGWRRVFYGEFVHQGHRNVRRNAAGVLYEAKGFAKPVPFAAQAVESLGDQQAEKMAEEILNYIVNGER